MNPLLNRRHFIPDVEAHVMPDGRLYIYGSQDISGSEGYCSKELRTFSTNDSKLEQWEDHGVIFTNNLEKSMVPWSPDVPLYAPDAIEKDGKYYLYVCGMNNFEGVAVADSPRGPFCEAQKIEGVDGDSIDPAVFVDDDGAAYLFWGQFSARGARLAEDMMSIETGTLQTAILTEQEHGFHEGASLRKRNGKYYMVYTDISRGRATCLAYAMADHPLGPYKKGGVIIDNMYCDPSTWNNHGSIAEFGGRWFVFYHRSSQDGVTSRRVCAEPIYFNEDGTINEVEMTSQGASDAINAFKPVDAAIACRMKGNGYIIPDARENKEILTNCGGRNWTYDWAEYKYLNFGAGVSRFFIRAKGVGIIDMMTDGGKICGSCTIDSPDDFCEVATDITPIECIRPIWLQFRGENLAVSVFRFE